MGHCRFFIILPVISAFLLSLPQASAQTKPTVISTVPANGATSVSNALACISVTFSKPMYGACGMGTSNWLLGGGSASCSWSGDARTMTYCRPDPTNNPLSPGSMVTVYLNPAGVTPWIKDTDGNYLDSFSFSFSVKSPAGTGKVKVPATPQNGFSWPYYLYTPITVTSPGVLMVHPNNTGSVSDDLSVHDAAASVLVDSKRAWADELGVPLLVPVFPRPASVSFYTHALDRGTIQTKEPSLMRLDLQLINMVEDARARLSSYGKTIDSKVFMVGVSAAGSFVSRFLMLHPDRVKAASIGAPGFGPIVPVSSFNGQTLPYPEGVADLATLTGQPFDATSFGNVPLQVWVGDQDLNIDPWWTLSDPTVALVSRAFGGRYLYQRWPLYEAAYGSVSSMGQFVIFPKMGHQYPEWSYLKQFFERNRSTPQPPLPKPQLYKIYFPQVASYDSWETEIALVNTIPGGVPVKGKLEAYGKKGGSALESISVEIPPGGRKEITVGSTFHNTRSIGYMVFVSDSGFLAGYTRYDQPGNRVTMPATASGATEGWFAKMETDGWTGIACVNTEASAATVVLKAFDENGNKVAEKSHSVSPGEQMIGIIFQLFDTDISSARYFSFTSDKEIIGFSISGSEDGLMLDGLMNLPRYVRD